MEREYAGIRLAASSMLTMPLVRTAVAWASENRSPSSALRAAAGPGPSSSTTTAAAPSRPAARSAG